MPTRENPSSGINWESIFSERNVMIGRAVTEVGRLYPVYGLASGVVADGLQWYADFQTIEGEDAPVFGKIMHLRNFLNMVNNAVGHILYVDQLIQDGLVGSGVGAPFAAITATINEVGKGWKVGLDGLMWLIDMGLMAGASYRAQKAPPGSPSAQKWQAQANNYLANMLGDFLTFVMDAMDLGTGGATQGSVVTTATQAAKGAVPILKWAAKVIPAIIQSAWNVWGGDLFPNQHERRDGAGGAQPAAQPAAGAARMARAILPGATGSLARSPIARQAARRLQRLEAGGMARGAAFQIIALELRQMRVAYDIGDTMLTALVQAFVTQKDQALQNAQVLLGGRDPFVMLRDGAAEALNMVQAKIGQAAQIEAFSTTATEKTAWINGVCDDLLGKIDGLTIPDIQLPEADLGDNALANAAESVINLGGRVVSGGVNAVLGQVRSALDSAKGAARGPIESVKGESTEIGEFLQVLSQVARDQMVQMQGFVARLSGALAQCQNGEQVIDLAIRTAMDFAGIDGEFQIQDIRDAWNSIGPMIDEGIEWAEGRRDASLGPPGGNQQQSGGPQMPDVRTGPTASLPGAPGTGSSAAPGPAAPAGAPAAGAAH